VKSATGSYNIILRIFVPKRDEVTRGWRKLNNEELHILYFSTTITRIIMSRKTRRAGHVARIGEEKKNTHRILVGMSEGKRPLGRPRHRWVDNIKMDHREEAPYGLDLSGLG
jgi:hypothetical protein